MYYAIVLLSVVLFGICFALNDTYRKLRTSCLASSLESAFVGSVAGLGALLVISGFSSFRQRPLPC